MHPWGIETFRDEIACDWLEDLFDSEPVAFLAQSLDLGDAPDLHYLACTGVLCAAELIHAKHSHNNSRIPEILKNWIRRQQELDLSHFILPAMNSLRQVLTSDSELPERWRDNERDGDLWLRHKLKLVDLLESDFLERSRVC